MQQFNSDNFLKNIEEDLKEARKISSDLADDLLNDQYENQIFNRGNLDEILSREQKKFNEYALEGSIKRAIIKVRYALECLNLLSLLKEFETCISQYKTFHDQFEHISYIGVLINPVIRDIQNYIDAIGSQSDPQTLRVTKFEDDLNLLERILTGTPKIITDHKLEPKNEAEIRGAVYKILIHVFPDTVREISIPKISKVYKPDIGIIKLKCAIEYKFVDSLEELKRSIGGIFEDIKGYSGSEDWKIFYAIIYQTDHFMTQAQIEEEFKISRVGSNWKPILVYGKGKRLVKKGVKKISTK